MCEGLRAMVQLNISSLRLMAAEDLPFGPPPEGWHSTVANQGNVAPWEIWNDKYLPWWEAVKLAAPKSLDDPFGEGYEVPEYMGQALYFLFQQAQPHPTCNLLNLNQRTQNSTPKTQHNLNTKP